MGLFQRNTVGKESKIDFVFRVPSRTLDDFAGYESLKLEGRKRLLQATQNYFLRGTDSYIRMLLEGVGGVGKSYFASCLAGEATRMIMLNKKVEERITSDLAEIVREEVEKALKIDPKAPQYQGYLGKAKYIHDKLSDGTTPALINRQLEDFETVLKTYKIMLFNDTIPKEEFKQKVNEAYLKKLKALAKKKGVFSDSAEKLESELKLDALEKRTIQKKSKDSAFEELILEKYTKHEEDIRSEIQAEYHKTLVDSIITELLEVNLESEEGQSLVKKLSKKSLEELRDMLSETKPREVIRASRKAWASMIGLPESTQDMVAYVEVNGADFAKLYVGTGAKNVESLFKEVRNKAKEYAAVVLNIEEIDALGSDRTMMRTNDERRATLNKLLQEMSGPNSDELNKGIILVASTNLAQILDPAIIRSGRFGKPIAVRIPTESDLNRIIKYHFSQLKLGPDVDLDLLAVDMYGATGADIKELKEEAQTVAQMKKRTSVSEEDVKSALYRVIFGLSNDTEFTEKDKEQLAFHEAGHALAMEKKDRHKEVAELVLESYGPAAAFVRERLRKDRPRVQSRKDIYNSLMVWYGGIIAEETIYGEDQTSFGATHDIVQATELIKRSIRSGILGSTYLNLGPQNPDEEVIAKKAEEVANKAVEETRKFIQENKNYLIALKEIGSIKGKLSGEEVKALCNLSKEKVIGVTEIIKTEGCEDEERYFNLINGRIQPE